MSLSPVIHHRSGRRRDPEGQRIVMSRPIIARRDPGTHLLIWVLRGRFEVRSDDREAAAGPGDLVVVPPHRVLRYRAVLAVGWDWMWLHYGGSAARQLSAMVVADELVAPLGFDPVIQARFAELVALGARAVTVTTPLCLDAGLFNLLALMADRRRRLGEGLAIEDVDLSPVLDHIEDSLGSPVTLSDLVAVSGFSASHLSRLFRSQLGVSPMRYVNQMRMRRAADLLETTNLPVGEIGRSVGFADPYHFSRRFRSVTGVAPTTYRVESQGG